MDKEADLMDTFLELCPLLPEKTLDIVLIGPQISPSVSGSSLKQLNVTISRHSGLLQDYLSYCGSDVDLVVCMNAGLSAYQSWKDAVSLLVDQRINCYVTDVCILSIHHSQQHLSQLSTEAYEFCQQMHHLQVTDSNPGLGYSSEAVLPGISLTEPVVNPFRSPLRLFFDCARLPWFSNAFICQLIYS